MKLADLLAVCADSLTLGVWDAKDGRLLATYDGRDSIDKKFNEWYVISVCDGEPTYYGIRGPVLDVLISKEVQR